MTHTPGPWNSRLLGKGAEAPLPPAVIEGRSYVVAYAATVFGEWKHVALVRNEADVSLIAAAPELLEALEYAVSGNAGHVSDHFIEQACVAIAKAKGEA